MGNLRGSISLAAAAVVLGAVALTSSGVAPAAVPVAATSDVRLALNAGFESGLTSWTADPEGAVSAVGTPVHSGGGAARIIDNSPGSGASLRSAPLAVVPGEDLTASISVQQAPAGAGGSLYLEFWRADGTRTTPVTATPAAAATGWQQLTAAGTAPDDAVAATVLAYSSFADSGTTYWDDAAVTALPPPLRRVPNAGFEERRDPSGPTEWTVDTPPAVTFQRGLTAHGGTTAIQVKDASTSTGVSVRSRAVPVAAGESITAYAWANRIDSTGASLYLEFRDAAGNRIGAFTSPTVTGAGWQRISVGGTAPPNTTTLSIRLYSSLAGTGTTRWDDVSLRSSADPSYQPALAAASPVLFVGDQRVESYQGVTRVVHPGTKAGTTGKVLVPGGQPWDANPRMSGTVLPGGPGYLIWYSGSPISSAPRGTTGYATSVDGINWTGPHQLASNLPPGGVVVNPNWTATNGQPHYFGLQTDAANTRYLPSQSATGVGDWAPVPGATAIPGFDVGNVTWDPTLRIFVAMTKHQISAPWGPRTTWVSTSTDFKTWTTPRPAFAADLLDDARIPANSGTGGDTPWSEIYGMPAFRYGDQYLGTPWVFDIINSPGHDTGNPGADIGRSHIEIAASRDLVNWSRPSRTDIITPGVPDVWDAGFATTSNGFVNVRAADGSLQTRFYYGAFAGQHSCDAAGVQSGACAVPQGNSFVGMVSWPADRFTSFHANGSGVVTTRPLTVGGGGLSVNYQPPAGGGSLTAELLDSAGSPIAAYGVSDPVTTDARAPGVAIQWGTKTALPTGPFRVRFTLTGGDLYGFSAGS